jgi:hypothetical protein
LLCGRREKIRESLKGGILETNKQNCKTRKLVGCSKASLKECGLYGTNSGSLRLLLFMLAFLGLGIPLKDTCYYRNKKDQK